MRHFGTSLALSAILATSTLHGQSPALYSFIPKKGDKLTELFPYADARMATSISKRASIALNNDEEHYTIFRLDLDTDGDNEIDTQAYWMACYGQFSAQAYAVRKGITTYVRESRTERIRDIGVYSFPEHIIKNYCKLPPPAV